jgi:aminoglycoside 3-N-acetyltransferase
VPFTTAEGVRWRMVEEFDTSEPIVAGLADDYCADIVREFLASGQGAQGLVGGAPSVLVEAAPICHFAVQWLERNMG